VSRRRKILVLLPLFCGISFVVVYSFFGAKLKKQPHSKKRVLRPPKPIFQLKTNIFYYPDPKGKLCLEGQVVDRNQIGVEGALVAVDTRPPRSTRTDMDGSFAINKLAAREYIIEARAGLHTAGPASCRLSDSSEPVILILTPRPVLEVAVVDATNGHPLAGATVELHSLLPVKVRTGQNGKASLQGLQIGKNRIRVLASGYAPSSFEIEGTVTGAKLEHTIELFPGAPVSGRVVDVRGHAVNGALVRAKSASSFQRSVWPAEAVSDQRGHWAFSAMNEGVFRFSAQKEDMLSAESPPVLLDGRTRRDNIVIRMSSGKNLSGIVRFKDGRSVSGAQITNWDWSNLLHTFLPHCADEPVAAS